MGYNPFWPTSLATVNVLCVPASPLTPSRFDLLFNALKQITEIKCEDLNGWNDVGDDHIVGPGSCHGSILLDYSKATTLSGIERYPLEPNSGPQIILGIYCRDSSTVVEEEVQSNAGRLSSVQRACEALQSRYSSTPGVLVCKLICIDNTFEDEVQDGTIAVPDLEIDSIQAVIHESLLSLKLSIFRTIHTLGRRPISSPKSDPRRIQDNTLPPPPDQQTIDTSVTDGTNGTELKSATIQGGRHSICCGIYCLQLGHWLDAIRHLSHGAADARNDGDILWHAKAVECLLVCMTLCTWRGIDFVIPEILNTLKAGGSLSLGRASSSTTSTEIPTSGSTDPSRSVEASSKFLQIAPAIAQMSMSLYGRLEAMPEQLTPPAVLTEARIRLLNFLILTYSQHDGFDQRSFDDIVTRKHQRIPSIADRIAGSYNSSLPRIEEMLIQSLPATDDSLQSPHYLTTLIAVVDSLSRLGLTRRHAFYFRDLLEKLIPVLIQARKIGASEAGVHPAATYSSTITGARTDVAQMQFSIGRFLGAAAASYGLVGPKTLEQQNRVTRLEDIQTSVSNWWHEQNTADSLLRLELLRLCVGVCDALPDLASSLYFSSYLLRTTKQSVTISQTKPNTPPSLSVDDQSRFLQGVKRTVTAAIKAGEKDLRAQYWDEFLVRDIRLADTVFGTNLTAHAPKDLSVIENVTDDKTKDPFLFNPFAKPKIIQSTPTIVANERATFSVLLQNPLEVDIEVDDIILLADGCDFEASHHSMVLGSFSSQTFSLNGIARKSGELRIRGCKATINSCYQQEYLIFRQDWQPPVTVKQKQGFKNKRQSTQSEGSLKRLKENVIEAAELVLKVIEPQPRIEIHAAKMIQPSLMLLEGEKKSVVLTLTNRSREISADFVLFTFDDNVTNELEGALTRKDILPMDTYEIQYQMKFKSTIKAAEGSAANSIAEIMPKKDATYVFEVFGRPGLVNATVQVDFTRLGAPRSSIRETFYTRQTRFPIAVTVNGSVEILRCNVLPISGDFAWSAKQFKERLTTTDSMTTAGTDHIISRLQDNSNQSNYCMLVLDLRNVWPQPLTIELNATTTNNAPTSENIKAEQAVEQTLQPGLVSRVVLIVERLFVADPYAPIPNLGVQRQFVVSASRMTIEAEAATREAFWYREELLKHLKGSWHEEGTGRHGEIDLRKGIRLNSRMIDALKVDHVDISFSVKSIKNTADSEQTQDEEHTIKQIGNSHFVVPTETFATLFVQVRNRTKDKLQLLLRLQPALRNQPHNIALDLSKRFLWSGVLQRPLIPAMEPGGTYDADLGIMILAEGEYEVNATVEEIKGRREIPAPTDTDVLNMSHQRRIWHAKSPCLIDAYDATS